MYLISCSTQCLLCSRLFVLPSPYILAACFYRHPPFHVTNHPLSLGSCAVFVPLCPFTKPADRADEKDIFKNINANLILAYPPPPWWLRSAEKGGRASQRQDRVHNQLIWSSALGNGERKRSWGTDIHLLGMIELRTEWELQRREDWRNEVLGVTVNESACAWEIQCSR